MCLQCVTTAKKLVDNVLPGYSLYQAVDGCQEWPKNWYGLVQRDDPDFIWEDKPIPDPTKGLSDVEINNMDDHAFSLYHRTSEKIEKSFKTDPMTGYNLVKACMSAGYDPDKDGLNVVMWLVGVAGEKLQSKQD